MAGRPPILKSAEEAERLIDEYFDTEEQPTWTGLALHLGFATRSSLTDYLKKPEFFPSIKKGLSRIEELYEKQLSGNKPTGAIFALKNFGWHDRQEVEQSGGITIKFEEPSTYVYPSQDEGSNGEPEGL